MVCVRGVKAFVIIFPYIMRARKKMSRWNCCELVIYKI